MLVWELIGAAIGAGFASGREIAVFFAQYGNWGYVGLAAAGGMLLLAGEPFPSAWEKTWLEKVWQIMISFLLITTGGAMLAGAGEIWTRVLSMRSSYAVGIVSTMGICLWLAVKTKAGLAWVSRGLTALLAVQILLAFTIQPMNGAIINESKWHAALASGVSYGGFNAALQWPVVAAAVVEKNKQRHCVRWATLIILLLLLLGILLMKRNVALMGEAMPFLVMMKRFGAVGYGSYICCLYLAVLSTLTACVRAVRGRIIPVLMIALISCAGFGGVVNRLYPVLGGMCCVMLLLAKITNSFTGSFLSKKDML